MSVTTNESTVTRAIARIREIAPEFARASEHVGSSLLGQYSKVVDAFQRGELVEASSLAEKIRSSDLIVRLSSQFRSLGDKLGELRDELAPWMGVIGGLVAFVAGYFLVAQIGVFIAGLLMIGGLVYAIRSGLRMAMQKGPSFG